LCLFSLFALLISHQPAVLFSKNKSATSNQPAVLLSQNKPAPAVSHRPNEQTVCLKKKLTRVQCSDVPVILVASAGECSRAFLLFLHAS
jgi:hypothetical protein